MNRLSCSLVVACVGVVASACPAPADDGTGPAATGPALLFEPLPDAFRLPDDDVAPAIDGLQIEVELRVENDDAGDIEEVRVVSAGGFEDFADVVDGKATASVALDVGALPAGADNVVVATAADLEARRTIVGLDRRVPEGPPPVACDVTVDVVGTAVVTCGGGDPDRGDIQDLVNGGVVALSTRPDVDGAAARVRSDELRGGAAVFDFAFDVDGSYEFTARLVGANALVGRGVSATTTATVDVP